MMFIGYQNEKAVLIWESDFPLCVEFDKVEKDENHHISDYVDTPEHGYVLSDSAEAVKMLQSNVRLKRNALLQNIQWRVDRCVEERHLGLQTSDQYEKLLSYKQYLRDYPESSAEWYLTEPLSYEQYAANL